MLQNRSNCKDSDGLNHRCFCLHTYVIRKLSNRFPSLNLPLQIMQYQIPLQIIDLAGDGFHPLIDISLFGRAYKLVLDTGASRTALDKTILAETEAGELIMATNRLSTGLGTNNMESFTAKLNSMMIGELHVAEFEVAVLDLSTINIAYEQLHHPKVLGVLGGDILVKYKAVIDYNKLNLKLSARKKRVS